jgi:hypothetical protein
VIVGTEVDVRMWMGCGAGKIGCEVRSFEYACHEAVTSSLLPS